MSTPPKTPASVALEDLLRLKRAERPDAAFWNEFERGLRQKQLAAIMEPRPWWLGLSLALRRPSVRAATAVAACALVAISLAPRLAGPEPTGPIALADAEARQPGGAQIPPAGELAQAEAAEIASAPVLGIETVDTPLVVAAVAAAEAAPVGSERRAAVVEPGRKSGATSGDVLASAIAQVAMVARGDFKAGADVYSRGEGARSSAATSVLVAVATSPAVTLTPGFETEVLSDNEESAVANLAFADSVETLVTDPRHRRLLAGVEEAPVSRSGIHSLAAVRDHVLHHVMNNDELYASISRLGVSGDRLHLRF